MRKWHKRSIQVLTSKNKIAFSLLEMMVAITIFTLVGAILYTMSNTINRTMTSSLGKQRFNLQANAFMDSLEGHIAEALSSNVFNANDGTALTAAFVCTPRNNNPTPSVIFPGTQGWWKKEFAYVPPRITFIPNAAYRNALAVAGVQQLQFIASDESIEGAKGVRDFLIDADNANNEQLSEISEDTTQLKEKILYLTEDGYLQYFERKELDNSVDGIPDNDIDSISVSESSLIKVSQYSEQTFGWTFYVVHRMDLLPWGVRVVDIEYIFWGSTSTNWTDGDAGQPIRHWDTRNDGSTAPPNDEPWHQINELPKAIKIFLTLRYNPDMYNRNVNDLDPNKDEDISIERIVEFTNYQI